MVRVDSNCSTRVIKVQWNVYNGINLELLIELKRLRLWRGTNQVHLGFIHKQRDTQEEGISLLGGLCLKRVEKGMLKKEFNIGYCSMAYLWNWSKCFKNPATNRSLYRGYSKGLQVASLPLHFSWWSNFYFGC